MKTLVTSLFLAATLVNYAVATPKKPATAPAAKNDLSQQVGSFITYPASLPKNPNGSVVMIQFKVGADSRLRKLDVLTADTKLNDDLVRQLTGRKLALANTDPEEVHTLRIHFRPD